MFYVNISLCVQSDWSDVAVWSKECGSAHLHGASLGQRPLSNREISRELIESHVKLQRSVFLLLCRLHKTALASLREQQGLVVSDCVVSHSGGCLETHGWVQLPAITERVCVCVLVCVAYHERHLEMELQPLASSHLRGGLPTVWEGPRLFPLLRGSVGAHLWMISSPSVTDD